MALKLLIGALIFAGAAPTAVGNVVEITSRGEVIGASTAVGDVVEITSRGEVIPLVSPVRASNAARIFEPAMIERLVRISGEASLANIGPSNCVYVGILSGRKNTDKRQRVRQAFLNDLLKENQDGNGQLGKRDIKVFAEFIIGHADPPGATSRHQQSMMAPDSVLTEEVDLTNEAKRFRDIRRIQAVDQYKDLTDKVMQVLEMGVIHQCRLVVKIDDDQLLNVTEARRLAGSLAPEALYYGGKALWDKPAYETQRGVDHVFEPYFAGPAYVLSYALALRIVDSRMYNGEFQLYGSSSEDVDMGRWIHHQVALGANVTYATIPINSNLPDPGEAS